MGILLDTHAIIWYLAESKDLSKKAYELIDAAAVSGSAVCVSVISLVEIIYLAERGRVPDEAYSRLVEELSASGSTALSVVPLDSAVAETLRKIPRDQVPDMPDRIIAATAMHLDLPLVTRDRRLQAAGIHTIW